MFVKLLASWISLDGKKAVAQIRGPGREMRIESRNVRMPRTEEAFFFEPAGIRGGKVSLRGKDIAEIEGGKRTKLLHGVSILEAEGVRGIELSHAGKTQTEMLEESRDAIVAGKSDECVLAVDGVLIEWFGTALDAYRHAKSLGLEDGDYVIAQCEETRTIGVFGGRHEA